MLQIRITDADGSNPIVLENAKNRSTGKAVNSSDEGIAFDIAKNDSKAQVINPDAGGYTKFWEVWETSTNTRLNRGPITQITEQGTDWKVQGGGRSSLLNDYIKTKKTFYASIRAIVDELRYENIAIQPRTSTLVHDGKDVAANTTVFGNSTINEKYLSLSKLTKDNVIDDQDGLIKPGAIEPPNTYYTTDSYWSGMSKQDSVIVDLGGVFPITKVRVGFPWWGGVRRLNNRFFDTDIAYADDTEATITTVQGKDFGPFHTVYENDFIGTQPRHPIDIYFGYLASGTGATTPTVYQLTDIPGPVDLRYIRVKINDVFARYPNENTDDPTDTEVSWAFNCDPNYIQGSEPDVSSNPGDMVGKVISDRILEPANDCWASVVEVGAFKEFMPEDEIKQLAVQRIDNNNLAIEYSHTPEASETITTDNGMRKFEPGGFFRRFTVNYSGASSSYNKFFPDDCSNCYPTAFNFGIMDHNQNLVYRTTNSSGTPTRTAAIFTSYILMKGSSDATVTAVDTWPAKSDPLSWGSSYSYSTISGDTATVTFRGESFKWYATIPEDETGAVVDIEIRSKTGTTWGAWSTLENNYQLPNNINSSIVYEITYESHVLNPETSYQIRITNVDGGYASIDSFEGYWSGAFNTYNEDSSRIFVNGPSNVTQIYDKRFSNGSMFKWNKVRTRASFEFEGDRVMLISAKGRNHGKLRVGFQRQGEAMDYYTIDLDTGVRGNESTQNIIWDSADHYPTGIRWGVHTIFAGLEKGYTELHTTTVGELESSNFVYRCKDCETDDTETVEINKFVYLDGIAAFERVGLSVSFENETHLDILKAVAEITQTEWEITEDGIRLEPRIGVDTDETLREGQNTLVDWGIVNDIQDVATILVTSGADIDGLPLFTITEDKQNTREIGRTVMRKEDFRNVADYFGLIGLSRTALKKRRFPEKRISVTHVAHNLDLNEGDSFILWTKKMGSLRVRIVKKTISENQQGRQYDLECIRWPLTV